MAMNLIIGALETVSKALANRLKWLDILPSIEPRQRTALLGLARIPKKVQSIREEFYGN